MTPKLSNLDIPEIKATAAEWALVSSQIEKITLHRFKPSKLPGTEGPFYSIIIWVSREVDVTNAPWMELSEHRVGDVMLPKEHVREQYIDQDGKFDREKASKHPLYDLWNLFLELSAIASKERECLYTFYRDGFERSDPRFDWLVLLLNIGDEYVFDQGGIYQDLDATDVGSVVLFSRKPAQQEEAVSKNAFIHQRDFWQISFQGNILSPIKHSDGMTYIARLIVEESIHVSDLYETAHPKSGDENILSDEEMNKALATREMSVSNMNLPKLTDDAKVDIKKHIREKQKIIDDCESLESEREAARHEIESIQTTLSREYGRKPLAWKETVKQNESVKSDVDKVRKSIRKAIETIHPHSSELAGYLTNKINYGTKCQFTGDPAAWTINF